MSFIIGKLLWLIAAPANFLLLLLAVGTLRLTLSQRQRGLSLVFAATVGLIAAAFLPGGEWFLMPLENRFASSEPPAQIDGIVVLGGAVDEVVSQARGRPSLTGEAERVVQASELARRYPQARVAVVGGTGRFSGAALPEAAVMRKFLVDRGVDPGRITEEARSRNTYENAVFGFQAVKPKSGESWILITSAAHMPRAVGCFRRAGWQVTPYPVDFRTTGRLSWLSNWTPIEEIALLNIAAKEWVGLAAYYVMGRTDTLFPGPD